MKKRSLKEWSEEERGRGEKSEVGRGVEIAEDKHAGNGA